jgi:predicted enzyme related to lactoylglutathione lyase
MADSHGRFVWYELMTTDTDGAKAFYGNVLGFGTRDAAIPGVAYSIFTLAETGIGGLMDLPDDAKKMGAPPSWVGYVGVDDVDAIVGRIQHLGGTAYVPPTDIPNTGRFAVVADPQRAPFAVFKPLTPIENRPEQGMPGRVGWHELLAADWEKAFAFYADLFGWQKAEAVDMGVMGTYQLFAASGQTLGGMFNKPAMIPAPFWLYYFNVDNIDAAATRVKEGSGEILNGPMQVPGGSWIVQCKDPQGAVFALVGPRS